MDQDLVTDAVREDMDTEAVTLANDIFRVWFKKTVAIWTVMYPRTNRTEWKQRYKRFLDEFKERVIDLHNKEDTAQLQLIDTIEKKLKELNDLGKELSVETNAEVKEDDPLTLMSQKLDFTLLKLRKEREERIQRLTNLRERENDLCECLGALPVEGISTVPSEEQLARIDDHIRALTSEKALRTDRYITYRVRIHEIMTALEVTPHTQFEKMVFDSRPFPLTDHNMEKLEELENEFRGKLEDAESHANLLINKLQKLWKRIKEPEEYREQFLQNHAGCGKSSIKALNDEIERAERVKIANLKPVMDEVRAEIASLWDKLTMTEDDRRNFPTYYSAYVSEEVLELLEIEAARLQALYARCEKLIGRALEREVLQERKMHLEELSKDKTRLFNNRGGQLLREEKERKELERKCPKFDMELINLLTEYEEEYHTPFMFRGENLLVKVRDEMERKMARSASTHSLAPAGRKRPHQGPSVNSSRVITRSQTPQSDTSTASCASYTYFQNNLGEPTFATPKRMAIAVKTPSKIARTPVAASKTPGRTPGRPTNARTPLRPIQPQKSTSAYRATSSPRGTTPNKRTMIPAPLSASRTPHRNVF